MAKSNKESNSISDSFGESMERAGYERANDSRGGWQEHESSDNYESTRDRMDKHLASRGKSNDVNQSISNPVNTGFGGRSAISQSIGTHYQSNAAASSAVSGNKRSLTNGLFGRDVTKNVPYSARQDWDNINALTPKDRIRDIAHHYAGESLSREHKGNAIGSVVSSIVGSTLEPTSMAEAIASAGAQLGLTKAGTAADTLLNKEGDILGKMTPGQKAVYQTESQKVKDAFSEDMDSWGSKLKGWGATALGFVGGAATGGVGTAPIGTAAKVIADNSRYNSAMQHAADKVNSREQMRKIAGNTEYTGQGILGTMQQRAKAANGQYKDEEDYSIPQLVNLWNNISVI